MSFTFLSNLVICYLKPYKSKSESIENTISTWPVSAKCASWASASAGDRIINIFGNITCNSPIIRYSCNFVTWNAFIRYWKACSPLLIASYASLRFSNLACFLVCIVLSLDGKHPPSNTSTEFGSACSINLPIESAKYFIVDFKSSLIRICFAANIQHLWSKQCPSIPTRLPFSAVNFALCILALGSCYSKSLTPIFGLVFLYIIMLIILNDIIYYIKLF